MAWQWPTTSTFITQAFHDPANPAHSGLDIGAALGQPIYAPTSATIERIWPDEPSGYGNLVILDTDDGRRVLLGHMSRFGAIQQGQKVAPGQVVGYVGQSGNATGPHLHFEVRNPPGHIEQAIDPTPLLSQGDSVLSMPTPPGVNNPAPTPGAVVDSPTPALDNITNPLTDLFGKLLQPQPADTTRGHPEAGQPATVITLFSTPLGPVKFDAGITAVDLLFLVGGSVLALIGLVGLAGPVSRAGQKKGEDIARAISEQGYQVGMQGKGKPAEPAAAPAPEPAAAPDQVAVAARRSQIRGKGRKKGKFYRVKENLGSVGPYPRSK